MENLRFDALAKRLYVLTSRPEGRRFLLSTLAAGFAVFAAPGRAVACRRRGDLCTRDGHCCSKACGNYRKRKLKDKKGKQREERVGKCACSMTGERCKIAADCCNESDACGSNDCDEGSVCCRAAGFPCDDDCDCCGDNICGESDTCEAKCSRTQEPCDGDDDCCFDDETCGQIARSCDAPAGTVCCGTLGSSCEENCDCCLGFQCDEDEEECIRPCSNTGEICDTASGPGACCRSGDTCGAVACSAGTGIRCCHSTGPCESDCDCCGAFQCLSGACGGA